MIARVRVQDGGFVRGLGIPKIWMVKHADGNCFTLAGQVGGTWIIHCLVWPWKWFSFNSHTIYTCCWGSKRFLTWQWSFPKDSETSTIPQVCWVIYPCRTNQSQYDCRWWTQWTSIILCYNRLDPSHQVEDHALEKEIIKQKGNPVKTEHVER